MTYLSRATIDKSQAARCGLHDSYNWHRKLWEVFPRNSESNRGFLFRVDDYRTFFCTLLLSDIAPVFPKWGMWECKEVKPSFLDAKTYRFQMKVNPTMRRNSDRRRLGIYREDLLVSW